MSYNKVFRIVENINLRNWRWKGNAGCSFNVSQSIVTEPTYTGNNDANDQNYAYDDCYNPNK